MRRTRRMPGLWGIRSRTTYALTEMKGPASRLLGRTVRIEAEWTFFDDLFAWIGEQLVKHSPIGRPGRSSSWSPWPLYGEPPLPGGRHEK